MPPCQCSPHRVSGTRPFSCSGQNPGSHPGLFLSFLIPRRCSVNKPSWLYLRNLSRVQPWLITLMLPSTTLIQATIVSHLSYLNSLLTGLPVSTFNSLQSFLQMTGRGILLQHKSDHIRVCPEPSQAPHLPQSEILHGLTPATCLATFHAPLCPLTRLCVPRLFLDGARPNPRLWAFALAGPFSWNVLPPEISGLPLTSFGSLLKTHLLRVASPAPPPI